MNFLFSLFFAFAVPFLFLIQLGQSSPRERRDTDVGILNGLISIHAPSRKTVRVGVLDGRTTTTNPPKYHHNLRVESERVGPGHRKKTGKHQNGSSSASSSSASLSAEISTVAGRVGTDVDVAGGLISVQAQSKRPVKVKVMGGKGDERKDEGKKKKQKGGRGGSEEEEEAEGRKDGGKLVGVNIG